MSPTEIAGLVVATLTSISILLAGLGWWITTKIRNEIRSSTYQIQPGSNGGQSLSDLHKKLDHIRDDLTILRTSVLDLENEMEGMK